MSDKHSSTLVFTGDELDLLARTADALSAYTGKPVLVEVVDASETGFEWALFAVPLDVNDNNEEITVVQVGGAKARLLGSQGGLKADQDTFSCRLLWIIQLSDIDDIRYIKLNHEGDDIGWSNELEELLPFELGPDTLADDEEDDITDIDPSQFHSSNNTLH